MNVQSTETRAALVNVSADANINVATEDNHKDIVDKEEEAPVKEQTIDNPQLVKVTTNEVYT